MKNTGTKSLARIALVDLDTALLLLADSVSHEEIRQKTRGSRAIGVWGREWLHEDLRQWAMEHCQEFVASERIWLHYGGLLCQSAVFRHVCQVVGQIVRLGEEIVSAYVYKRVAGQLGDYGSLRNSVSCALSLLQELNFLDGHQGKYQASAPQTTNHQTLMLWVLACALYASDRTEADIYDLMQSPYLFPFSLSLSALHLHTKQIHGIASQFGLTVYRTTNGFSVYLSDKIR